MSPPEVSLVIPAYNEEARLGSTLEALVAFLEEVGWDWEAVVVDDGSRDRTAEVAQAYAARHPRLRLLRLAHGGKGWAVRHGMLAARGRFRVLCDADLAMPPRYLPDLVEPCRRGYAVAVGSREAPGARRVGEPAHRHWMGRAFNLLVRRLAVPGIRDTQCGYKCFTAEAALALFPLQRVKGFAFDVEILYLARKRGLPVVEVPIEWHHRPESKVRPLVHTLTMLGEVLSVRWNDLRGRYRRPLPREAQEPARTRTP